MHHAHMPRFNRSTPFFHPLLLALFFVLALAASLLYGCATTPGSTDPMQAAINATANTCKANDAAIVAADAVVKQNVLKGQDARNVGKTLGAVQATCITALATIKAAAAAASGVQP